MLAPSGCPSTTTRASAAAAGPTIQRLGVKLRLGRLRRACDSAEGGHGGHGRTDEREPHGLSCYGSRDATKAIRSTMSASVRFASTGIISADMAPLRVPSFMSYICRAR